MDRITIFFNLTDKHSKFKKKRNKRRNKVNDWQKEMFEKEKETKSAH